MVFRSAGADVVAHMSSDDVAGVHSYGALISRLISGLRSWQKSERKQSESGVGGSCAGTGCVQCSSSDGSENRTDPCENGEKTSLNMT
jgi:hypothetical protein